MEDFLSFRFGNVSSEDLHLKVISVSDRYEKQVAPPHKDYTSSIIGGDGSAYFGSTFEPRDFKIEVAFDSVSEKNWRKISQIFSTDKLQDLIFDELPYKVYKAKLKSKPEFKAICFYDEKLKQRVYKGEGSLTFVCYFPYAYCFNKYLVKAADYYKEDGVRKFFNVNYNNNEIWKGGFSSFSQAEDGELFFNLNGEKQLSDTRNYFDNVPEWAESSGLLYSPTLDNEKGLIYMPQYSKINNINMDIGIEKENGMIGSRILVYNPGDIPIDFKLKIDNALKQRGSKFCIRRYNVQQLPISMAVDYTFMKTQNLEDNKNFKYGNKYFKKIKINENEEDINTVEYEEIKDLHPDFAYVAEPIPREKLGDYIRLFYYQSSLIDNSYCIEEGEHIANRYEELYNNCSTNREFYELYWTTLIMLLSNYKSNIIFEEKDFSEFLDNYINNPPEFFRQNFELLYPQINFNINSLPIWYTDDYLKINLKDNKENVLFLDTEKRILYNETIENTFPVKKTKNIFNEAIEEGHWFKIPTGWSLIDIIPVCDDKDWGGKTWLDARDFQWGYGEDKKIKELFDKVYHRAAQDYLKKEQFEEEELNFRNDSELEKYKDNKFAYDLLRELSIQKEYKFLKTIQLYWYAQKGKDSIKGEIKEWWFYACNYIWANFPPLYYGYADILNKAEIEYNPLFY